MAERSLFFDSVNGDREYPARDFAKYFANVIKDGVCSQIDLEVYTDGASMNSIIKTGSAFIKGYQYILDDEEKVLTHDTETSGNNRIDRIVLRLNLNLEERTIKAILLKGEPSATPQPPALTNTEMIYDFPLASVLIRNGQAVINQVDITNERTFAKIVNPLYRQIFIGTQPPGSQDGNDGDIWFIYE